MRNSTSRFTAVVALAGSLVWTGIARASDAVEVDSALLRLIEQVDVPAQEAGVLLELSAREGDTVAEGALLGKIKDTESLLARDRAKLELDIARRKAENDVSVRFARTIRWAIVDSGTR